MNQFSIFSMAEMPTVFKGSDDYELTDSKFCTVDEKRKIIYSFKKVMEQRDMNLMTKSLYNHLHLHLDFIAHYDIHGFRITYEFPDGFLRFINTLDKLPPYVIALEDYADVNRILMDILNYHKDAIKQKIFEDQSKREIALLEALAQKYKKKII